MSKGTFPANALPLPRISTTELRIRRFIRRTQIARPIIEGDPFPDQSDPYKHRARCAALRRRRAKDRVAKQSRKANR